MLNFKQSLTVLHKVKHKTDALPEPDMWCMKQIQKKKESRESGAGCGDLKLYLRGGAWSQLLQSPGNQHFFNIP